VRSYLITLYDVGGMEIPEFRKVIEAESWAEAEQIAQDYENECYEKDSSIDWYELNFNF